MRRSLGRSGRYALVAAVLVWSASLQAAVRDRVAWSPLVPKVADGHEYFIGPNGKADNAGTEDAPWDIESALGGKHPVKPGDILWLRGGKYQGEFPVELAGTAEAPIIIRQYPGERAIIDGFAHLPLVVGTKTTHVWFWGFEVMSGNDMRVYNDELPYKRGAVFVMGANNKFINLNVHDLMDGFQMWTSSSGCEVHGCLISNSGRTPEMPPIPDSGHGIRTQNDGEKKVISDNVIFNNFGAGIFAGGSEHAPVRNYDFTGNIVFCNGLLNTADGSFANFLIVGGGTSKDNITLDSNCTYFPITASSGFNLIGWPLDSENQNLTIRGNCFVGGRYAIGMWGWKGLTFTDNTCYAKDHTIFLNNYSNEALAKYVLDKNKYYGGKLLYNTEAYDLKAPDNADWQHSTKHDAASEQSKAAPTGQWAFVRANKYEPGRANICVYNWGKNDWVEVDMKEAGLANGDAFEVRDAQNFVEKPVATGVYDGKPITLPMKGLTAMKAVGDVIQQPTHTGAEFGAFVILKVAQKS